MFKKRHLNKQIIYSLTLLTAILFLVFIGFYLTESAEFAVLTQSVTIGEGNLFYKCSGLVMGDGAPVCGSVETNGHWNQITFIAIILTFLTLLALAKASRTLMSQQRRSH